MPPSKRSPVIDEAILLVSEYCASRIPPAVRSQVRLAIESRGKSITIVEERVPWDGGGGPWTRSPMAQFRLDAKSLWRLYWRDSRDRWHELEAQPARDVRPLLDELDRDESGVFWG